MPKPWQNSEGYPDPTAGSGAVRLSADFDRCFFHNGLPEMVAAEAGVVVFQSPCDGAGRTNPSEVEVVAVILKQC